MSGNIFLPTDHKADTDADGSSGHHESSNEGSDPASAGSNDQSKLGEQSSKSKKPTSTLATNSIGGAAQHTLSSSAAISTSTNTVGTTAPSVLGEERVVKQIVIPRNLPLGIEMEIKHLSAKLQKRVMKCNELRKQVSVINERKNQLEKDLDLLQKSEKHAQVHFWHVFCNAYYVS